MKVQSSKFKVKQVWNLGFGFWLFSCLLCGAAISFLPQTQLIVTFAALVVIVIVIAILARPTLGIALALIVGPFQPLERITLDLPLDSGQVVLALAFFAYLLRRLYNHQTFRRSTLEAYKYAPVLTLASAIYFIACFITFLVAFDVRSWLNEIIKLAQLFTLMLIVANERDDKNRAILIGAILISATGQAVFGIVQHQVRGFGPKEFLIPDTNRFRAYGTFEQPNPYAGYLGLTWVIAACIAVFFWRCAIGDLRFAIEKHRASKTSQSSDHLPSASSLHFLIPALLTTFIAIVCLYALRASGSRGGLLGAGAAIFVMALALLKHPLRWLGAVALVGLTLYTFGVVDLPSSFEQQLRDYGNIDVRTAHVTPITFSTIERLAHWQAAIRMAQANPWLGVGYGNYDAAYATYKLLQWDNSLGHAHNIYLNLLAETGAIGFVAYCVLWATIFVVTIRLVRHSSFIKPFSTFNFQHSTLSLGLLGAWAHFSAHNFFDNLFVANIHILIGVYLGLLIRHRNDNAGHERLNI